MTSFFQDFRYAIRQLCRKPVFTSVALLTIAVGTAANVSVFSVKDALLLRSVPATDPRRLVRIRAPENDGGGLFSYPEYAYLRDHSKTLSVLAAHYSTAPLYITANGETGEVQGAVVSSNYFPMLGLQPKIGRFFTAAEDSVPDRDPVAVIGYGFWKRVYRNNPDIIGNMLVINGHRFEIIGVMPEGFHGVEIGGMPNEIWIPSMMLRVGYRPCDGFFQPSCTFLDLLGRLAPGTTIPQTAAEIATLMQQLRMTKLGFDERLGISVTPAIGISGNRHYFLLLVSLLTAIGGVLLLIVCANIGGLLIARGQARVSELAMRSALGATRTRIVRQLLTESLLLACAGGAFGLVISFWASRFLLDFYSVDSEGYRHVFDIRLDANVLIYFVLVTVLAGVLFGLLPAWQASSTDLNHVLKSGGGNIAGSDRNRSRAVLAILQVALSLALLVGASLLVRGSFHLEASTNMDLHQVLGFRLQPELFKYPPDRARVFEREVLRRVRELPGVDSVSLAKGEGLVWEDNLKIRMTLPDKLYLNPTDEPEVFYKPIAPEYFETLRVPFVAGRDFSDLDKPGSQPVAIVNETLANKLSPSELPLDHIILLDDKPYQIVGVVKDAQLHSVIEAPIPVVYLAFWQNETLIDARMCVRVTGNPSLALSTIRRTIAGIDASVPVTEAMPLIEQVRGVYTDARVATVVVTCAAVLGLLLSAMGLYGVIAYEVGRRKREIGIRMALGARPQRVLRMFLKQAMIIILSGSACGGLLALTAARLLSAWLFGVRPSDPYVFWLAAIFLGVVVLLASYLPARHAARTDPMEVLRYQ